MAAKPYHFILLGPQGSGKGTQAEVLARRFRLAKFETGALFRAAARRRDAIGRRLNRLVNEQGKLVPDSIVSRIVSRAIAEVPKSRGIVFDGFPRNLTQAKLLNRLLKRFHRTITAVIYLPVQTATTVRRLGKRRMCERNGHLFILGANLKPSTRRCPRCGSRIVQRADDKPAAIRQRLKIYNRLTRPLVSFYRRQGVLLLVDGEPPIPVVTKAMFRSLRERGVIGRKG